ncbi:MAG: hypothetical protein INR69_13535 [Mucilaginibacter polytrichastri]|nr:hypothetical protein [Mucilaginibacter polytrichastri]
MNIEQVVTAAQVREFVQMPVPLYKNDPHYIRPLDADVEAVFDPEKNALLANGACARWILRGEKGSAIGRIAAFVNPKTCNEYEQPTGGTGFFECIDDQQAADLLFNTAKNWLAEKGMEAMDGPVNFGDRDRWWGLLTDGFLPPNYCCNYNPPYYQALFERYGFEVFFRQYTYWKALEPRQPELYEKVTARLLRSGDYTIRKIEKRRLEKYAEDFRTIYNKAWASHEGVDPMTAAHTRKLLLKMKPVIDERIAFFAYHKDEPIGFFLCLPELNELFVKDVRGNMNWFGILRLLWNQATDSCKTMYGLAFGVIPEYQRKGVEAALVVSADHFMREDKVPYASIQMNWIGDFNPRMMHVAEQINAVIYKTHHTYRYLFDRTKPFKRMQEL